MKGYVRKPHITRFTLWAEVLGLLDCSPMAFAGAPGWFLCDKEVGASYSGNNIHSLCATQWTQRKLYSLSQSVEMQK